MERNFPIEKIDKTEELSAQPKLNFYQRLGLLENAPQDEIKEAFRRLASRYHPEAPGGGNEEKMKGITEAYAVLKDPEKRAAYDTAGMSASGPTIHAEEPTYENYRKFWKNVHNFNEDLHRQATGETKQHPVDAAKIALRERLGTYGLSAFQAATNELKEKGYREEANALLNDADIRNGVVNQITRNGTADSKDYDREMTRWAEAVPGLDRSIIDRDPLVLATAVTQVVELIDVPTEAGEEMAAWEKINPRIKRDDIVRTEVFAKSIKAEFENQRSSGEAAAQAWRSKWQELGVTI